MNTGVQFSTLRRFKQWRSIPDIKLEIVHLAMQKSSQNSGEQNIYDFVASDLGLHCLKVLKVRNCTAGLI